MNTNIWNTIKDEVKLRIGAEPSLEPYLNQLILSQKNLTDSVASVLASKLNSDALSCDGDLPSSSFQASGLHTTVAELQDKDALEENIAGAEIAYKNDFLTIGGISTVTYYRGEINRNLSMYSQFQFNNNINWVNGAHYSLIKRNINVFGEVSRSLSGGSAQLHGLLASLHPNLALSILYRDYDRDFQGNFSSAISENSNTINEEGLYAGVQFKINNNWEISSYFDQFKFPWMKYQVDKPNTTS